MSFKKTNPAKGQRPKAMEQDLIDKINDGDERAFVTLYYRFYAPLCAFSMLIVGDKRLAEEIVDDVFFSLWERRGQLTIETIEPYLSRSVKYKSLTVISSAQYRHTALMETISKREIVDFIDNMLCSDDHPLSRLLEIEMSSKMNEIISRLPDECRRVYRMSREEGKSYQEIAKEIGISVNTVKYHIKKALRVISSQLFAYFIMEVLMG